MERGHGKSCLSISSLCFLLFWLHSQQGHCSSGSQELQAHILSLSRPTDPKAPFPVTLGKVSGPGHVPTPAAGTAPEPGQLGGQKRNQKRGSRCYSSRMEAAAAPADHPSSPSRYRASLPPSLLLHYVGGDGNEESTDRREQIIDGWTGRIFL